MYVNAKIIPVEIIPGMGEYRRAGEGMNPVMIYLIDCKNFCKCTMYPSQEKQFLEKDTF
jgi:hypothetical protein